MDKKIKVYRQIEEVREVLNNKLLQNALKREVLNISWELDKLIAEYMKIEIENK